MSSSETSQDSLLPRLTKVEQLIAKRALTDAAKELNKAAQASPGDPRVYILGSRLAEAAGNPKDALASMRRAATMAPGWPVAVIELGFLLARQNQFKDALEQAEKAMALAPDEGDVVGRAIDIAHRAQHFERAIDWLRIAVKTRPDNLHLQQMIARDLGLLGRHGESRDAYTALIESGTKEAQPAALIGRIQAVLKQGKKREAQKDAKALLALDPDNEEYRFWSELAHGRTPSTQPTAMVRELYRGFADLYDQHTVQGLRYQLPRQVAQRILALPADRRRNVLDLGCGTGLLGACLGRPEGALVGVDVSREMVEQAARRNVYDKFHNVNLLDALRETPAGLYEVITACDVLIYVGDLAEAIPNAYRVLAPGGHFIFSCEAATDEEGDLALRTTMRYAHSVEHVRSQCKAAGFADVSIENTELRLEDKLPVEGFIVTARKPD